MYKIKKILQIADFKLVLEYSDGVSILADFMPIIQQGKVFQPLQDPNFFAKVNLDKTGRYIYWEGELEFCADALRSKGTAIDEDNIMLSSPCGKRDFSNFKSGPQGATKGKD